MRRQTMTTSTFAVAGLASVLLFGGAAHAQDVALPEPIGEPATSAELAKPEDPSREINLSDIVLSAARGVTTVQEAPSIITIITADEIKQRGFKFIGEALDTVPGWQQVYGLGQQVNLPLVRGVQQAALLLQDGLAMADPFGQVASLNRTQPMERIKRLEIVTGPGGVLWGANSFLGIVNIISKGAEDVNGLELSAGYGDGSGNKQHFRAYAMFGKTFWGGKLKIFQHVSYENYLGPVNDLPQFVADSPSPQPPGPAYFGRRSSVDPERTWMVTIDGKISLGPVTLYYMVPVGDIHPQLVFSNAVVPNDTTPIYDRYAALEYKDRMWDSHMGLTIRGYYSQFLRGGSIQVQPASSLYPPFVDSNGQKNYGGLHFNISNQLIQRAGGNVDIDLNLKHGIHLLFGGELFYEAISGSTTSLESPQTPETLPLVCPVVQQADGTFAPIVKCPRQFLNDANRIVGALYLNAQYRPVARLILDAGVRLQKGFGLRPYDLTPLYSGAIVWNFLPHYHLKATYATGFRPTVFDNTEAPQGGISFGANPNLKNETSQSFQGELNARLLRNVRQVREFEIRIDYSYTFLDRIIQIHEGTFANTGQRVIHSAELYAKLYLHGDHFLQASYTFLHSTTSDSGLQRNVPNHWVSLGAVFNIVKRMLDLNMNLVVTGAYEDVNRYPSIGAPIGGCVNPDGTTLPPAQCAQPTTSARTSDLTVDRLTPVAFLQLGFRLRFLQEKLIFSGQFYNVLNQHAYSPDPFNDLTPSQEISPTPYPAFNFFGSVTYRL